MARARNLTQFLVPPTGPVDVTPQERQLGPLLDDLLLLHQKRSAGIEEKLREIIALMGSESILSLPLAQIRPNLDQPRQTFTEASLGEMARTLKRDGQILPVLVYRKGDNYYLFDGERRWRSAQLLNWTALQAVVLPEPQDLQRKTLISSLYHETLNGLDAAEGICRYVARRLEMQFCEVPTLLYQVVNRANRHRSSGWLTQLIVLPHPEQRQALEELGQLDEMAIQVALVIYDLGLNINSVANNYVITLSWHELIKNAIRRDGLLVSHAKVIQKVARLPLEEDRITEEIQRLIRLSVAHHYTARQLSSEIARLRQSLTGITLSLVSDNARPDGILKDRFHGLTRRLNRSQVWSDPQKAGRLAVLLDQIESLL